MNLQGMTLTHPFPSLIVFMNLYFKCCFCEVTDNAAQNLGITLLQRSGMLLKLTPSQSSAPLGSPQNETPHEATCPLETSPPWLPPGISLATVLPGDQQLSQCFLHLLSHLQVPVLREHSSQTEACKTKYILSFEDKTKQSNPTNCRGLFPLPLGTGAWQSRAQDQTVLAIALGLGLVLVELQ